MTTHKPTGWNTWDFHGFNRLVYLHKGRTRVIVEYAIWDEKYCPPHEVKNRGGLHRAFRWDDVIRLGPHAPLGLPARLEFQAGGTPFRAEAVDRGGIVELTVTPLASTAKRVVFLFVAPVGATEAREFPRGGVFADCTIEFRGADWPTDYFLNVAEPYALGLPGQPATVRVTPYETQKVRPLSVTRADQDLERADEFAGHAGNGDETEDAVPLLKLVRPIEDQNLQGTGALADAPEAMMQAVTWNTLFDTRRRLVCSPVSRDWCRDWKGVLVFCWDTYLVGAFISYAAPELARLNFEAVTAAIDELGHVPNYYMAHGATSLDRSMPPLGSYLVWKTQVAAPDVRWLKRIYPRLAEWHRYWMAQRDGNGDGLLEWGSGPEPAYEFPQLRQDNPSLQHSGKCATYESGLDNSPMYDDVPFNPQTNTLELADVGLNSYYALDCEALARMAEFLGKRRNAGRYRHEYQAMRDRINERLWDEQHGIYCNRHWDGRYSPRWSPTSFFPLLAGIAPPERAERLVRQHLLRESEFWGDYVLPSISRGDPAFHDNDYWRGRIWGPFNFLVAEGLRRYRFDDVAAEFARRGLELFLRNWREDGGVYENYNAETGRGADVWNAARLYHWGGLLAFVAMQELIDVEPAGYLRLGSLKFPGAGLRNARVAGAVYDVELDAGLRVRRNGELFLESNTRAIVRLPLDGAPDRPIEVSAAGPGRLMLRAPGVPGRPLLLNGAQRVEPAGSPPVYTW